MHFLNLTLDSTSENLALDEALLDRAEDHWQAQPSGATPDEWDAGEVARLWQPDRYAVILGRGSKVAEEVNQEYCQQNQIPIYRRHSGGASVVIGPGSMLYSVILSLAGRPELRDLSRAHHHVMSRIQQAVQRTTASTGGEVTVQGICDLTLAHQKVSGNSLKVARNHFLYHGTILFDFDLDLLASCLRTPPRQPEYRQGRSHRDFVANLPAGDPTTFASRFARAFEESWGVRETLIQWPAGETRQLAAEKYESDEWNFRR